LATLLKTTQKRLVQGLSRSSQQIKLSRFTVHLRILIHRRNLHRPVRPPFFSRASIHSSPAVLVTPPAAAQSQINQGKQALSTISWCLFEDPIRCAVHDASPIGCGTSQWASERRAHARASRTVSNCSPGSSSSRNNDDDLHASTKNNKDIQVLQRSLRSFRRLQNQPFVRTSLSSHSSCPLAAPIR
jgi:hypothetical protein